MIIRLFINALRETKRKLDDERQWERLIGNRLDYDFLRRVVNTSVSGAVIEIKLLSGETITIRPERDGQHAQVRPGEYF